MRKRLLCLSLALAAAVGCRDRSTDGAQPSSERSRNAETGALYRFPRQAPEAKKADEPAAAISLTASDGTGLKLASLDARGVVQGPLAFTELRLAFDNPDDRTLEGTFRITLPQGAAISRFAMRQGDRWQEGEVVEKQAARQAYEDFLHRRQDPALLEQAAGNEFSARVFPIPARGRKELIVSYSQQITPEAPYTVALRGLPQVGKLDAVVSRGGDDAPILGQMHLENAAPDRDLVVDAPKPPPGGGVRAGDLVLVRASPSAGAGQDPVTSALVLVDTSASRALGFEAQIELIAGVAAALGQAPLVVAAFDQGIDAVYEGPAAGFAQEGAAKLRERQAFGASDLEGALTWARAKARASKSKRVIVVTDGVPTLGATEPAALRAAAASLKGAGVERLDALAVGGIRDDATLRGLCTAGLARDGVVLDGARGPAQAARRLGLSTATVAVKIEGAEWQWPERLEGFQPGDEALVYAKMPDGVTPLLSANGGTAPLALTEVDRPLLERAWVSAKIAQLMQKPPAGQSDEAVRNEIVRLSTSFRVLSPHTALLVLESEADYARYKIDRKALADILTVDGTRLVRQKRSEDALAFGGIPSTIKTITASDGVVLKPPALVNQDGQAAPSRESPAEQDRNQDKKKPSAAVKIDAAPMAPPAAEPAPTAAAPAAAAPARRRSDAPGDPLGNGFGSGGLGLSGVGEGGGGQGEGIGLGNVGSLARRPGIAPGHSNDGGEHRARPPQVRMGAVTIDGRLPPEVIQRIVRQNFGRFRLCYEKGLSKTPTLAGSVEVRFVIDRSGSVSTVSDHGSTMPDRGVVDCVQKVFRSLMFPQPEGGAVAVIYPIAFQPEPDAPAPPPPPPPPPPRAAFGPYQGKLAEVMEALSKGDKTAALDRAVAFRRESPGDVLALVGLGEAFEAMGETRSAARAYGSILDLFSSRADLRRMAGERLERLKVPYAQALAADSFAKAAQQRPDHPSSHRLLAFARLRAGDPAGAFDAIEAGAKRSYPSGRFAGVDRILREDAALIAAAWIKAEPSKKEAIKARLQGLGAVAEEAPSLRFVLNWETDANDVDFHIHDGKGGHAYYSQKQLASGGELYADVTTGYGPECFTIRKAASERAYPYQLQAHYYSRGPMGYGMGKLEIIEHDGEGNLTFEERPFVIMQDRAYVDLGTYPAGAKIEPPGRVELPRP